MLDVHVTHFQLSSMHSQYEEREGRKEKTAMYNNHIMLQEFKMWDVHVTFHAFPVVRRENIAVISKAHTGACGRVGLTD